MNLDIAILVSGVFFLLLLYLFFGRHEPLVGPTNIYIISVCFIFYGKFLWLRYGEPLEPLKYDASNALLFITLTNVFLLLFMAYLKRKLFNFPHRLVLSIAPRNIGPEKLIIIAALINILFAFLAGSSPFYGIKNPIEFRIFMQKGGMFYVEFLMFALMIFGVAALSKKFLLEKSISWKRFFPFMLLALAVALNSGLRGRLVEILLIPVIVFTIFQNRVPKIFLALIVIFIIPFATLFGIYRDSVRENSLNFDQVADLLQKNLSEGENLMFPLFMHRFDAFDNFVAVTANPPVNFFYGQSLLGVIAQPIPRAFWPDKPNVFTSEMTVNYNPSLFDDGIALTFSAYAEALLNFGYLGGVIALSAYLAFILTFLNRIFRDARSFEPSMAFYLLLYQLPFIIVSSGFINDISTILILMTCAFFAILRFFSRLVIR